MSNCIDQGTLADKAFAEYEFGDGVMVTDVSGWEYTTPGYERTRKVYVETKPEDDGAEPRCALNFTVRFDPATGALSEAYAMDVKGQIWGAMPSLRKVSNGPDAGQKEGPETYRSRVIVLPEGWRAEPWLAHALPPGASSLWSVYDDAGEERGRGVTREAAATSAVASSQDASTAKAGSAGLGGENEVTKVTHILQRGNGSQVRIVATAMFGEGLHRSIDVYVHKRESENHDWVLCSNIPAPNWVSVDYYIKYGRSQMLQAATSGEIMRAISEIGRPIAQFQDGDGMAGEKSVFVSAFKPSFPNPAVWTDELILKRQAEYAAFEQTPEGIAEERLFNEACAECEGESKSGDEVSRPAMRM